MAILQRLGSEAANFRRRLSGWPAFSAPRSSPGTPAGLTDWQLRDRMLSGALYLPSLQGGGLSSVLRLLGRAYTTADEAKYPIPGYYNPARQIVSFYANTLAGRFGEELTPQVPGGEPLKPAVADALARLWRWSNLESERGTLVELAANQGTAGIRVSFDPGSTGSPQAGDGAAGGARVFLQFDHPSRIVDAEEDARGNVREVLLEYDLQYSASLGAPESPVAIREVIGRDRHSFQANGRELLPPSERENPLGVCPYVILRHERDPQSFFGRHAYWGSERAIHGINWGLANLDESIVAHIWPYLFATGAGNAPTKVTAGKYSLIYSRSATGVPAPTFGSMVPPLNFGGALEHLKWLADLLRDRQPELALSNLSLLSGLSGETLAQVLKPAEAACFKARVRYEDALVRALQIGLSAGILCGLWDLGTGTGSREAAGRAYDDGQGPEAFTFNERPALPLTPFAKLNEVNARLAERTRNIADAKAAAGIVSHDEQLRIAGYAPDEVDRIAGELALEEAEALIGQQATGAGGGAGGGGGGGGGGPPQ